jgi:hypothetical protein
MEAGRRCRVWWIDLIFDVAFHEKRELAPADPEPETRSGNSHTRKERTRKQCDSNIWQ